MSKYKTYLIKNEEGLEGVIRLPVGKYGDITTKAFKMIGDRFYNGTTKQKGRLKYALCLEDYRSGESLLKAIEKYNNNII